MREAFDVGARRLYLLDEIGRKQDGAPCPCGGYADRVECTPEERQQFNCGRPYDCCSRAFLCRICGHRLVGRAEAPEMD